VSQPQADCTNSPQMNYHENV